MLSKTSDVQPTRRELLRMLKALSSGNVVTVTRIDRLARSPSSSTERLMIAVLGGSKARHSRNWRRATT
jgi:DNA invertase Pin-like site-specific DNA recombinase